MCIWGDDCCGDNDDDDEGSTAGDVAIDGILVEGEAFSFLSGEGRKGCFVVDSCSTVGMTICS